MVNNHSQEVALLTKTELEWLMGKKRVSKVYEYRIRSDIKKKLQLFQTSELPLLMKNGFLNELRIFTQLSANTQSNAEELLFENNLISNDYHLSYTKNGALGGNTGVLAHFRSRDLFLTKETLYQAELPRHRVSL